MNPSITELIRITMAMAYHPKLETLCLELFNVPLHEVMCLKIRITSPSFDESTLFFSEIAMVRIAWQQDLVSSNSVRDHICDKQSGVPLCGGSILLISRTTNDDRIAMGKWLAVLCLTDKA